MASVLIGPILTEGRHLVGLVTHHDAHDTETFAGKIGDPREKSLDLLRSRAGGDVVILRLNPEQLVAHTAPREIGRMSCLLQLGHQVTGLRVHGLEKMGSTSETSGGGVCVSCR